MMHSHANAILAARLGSRSHLDLSLADAAHGFVFVSGLVAGIVYTGRLIRVGEAAMTRAILSRVRTIYVYHALLAFALLALAAAALRMGYVVPQLAPLMQDPGPTMVLALGLSADLEYIDILPMYVVFMALSPLVLRLLHRGYLTAVVCGSVVLWLLAQTGFSEFITSKAQDLIGGEGADFAIGIYFNLLGWQLLFTAGLLIGYLVATGRNPTKAIAAPGREPMFYLAVALFAVFAPIALEKGIVLLGGEGSGTSLGMTSKENGAPIYMVSFVLNAFIFTWLLVAGPTSTNGLLRAASCGFAAVVTWRPLVFLGQHSLQAYAAHVLYVYILAFAIAKEGFSEGIADVLLITSPAPLFLGAWLHSRAKGHTLAST
jgi:hypothetical protein